MFSSRKTIGRVYNSFAKPIKNYDSDKLYVFKNPNFHKQKESTVSLETGFFYGKNHYKINLFSTGKSQLKQNDFKSAIEKALAKEKISRDTYSVW